MKKIIATLAIGLALTACAKSCSTSNVISQKSYADAMVALGCKDMMEGNPAANEVLKQNGATPEQIQAFRQKTDFKVIADTAAEIAKRVAACHGLSQ